jgi:hypothetical protein
MHALICNAGRTLQHTLQKNAAAFVQIELMQSLKGFLRWTIPSALTIFNANMQRS